MRAANGLGMTRIRSVDEADISRLADQITLEFTGSEAAAAADRVNTLADIYRDLETVPTNIIDPKASGQDRFTERPYSPTKNDDPYNAWLTRFDLARDNRDGVLSGMTVAIKDNTCVAGVELTLGSRAFEGIVPDEHAAVTERFLDAGARLVGKTNMDELAFGPTSETSAFGATENPNAPGHVTGGSSSGSAAAVAANEVDIALGTDTGGSVRIPASYCGIVGIKPTFGLVPLHGIVELAASMDHAGTLASDVETAARGLEAIADPVARGPDPLHVDLGVTLDGLQVGIVDRFFAEHVTPGVDATVRATLDALEGEGAEVETVEIPALDYSREAWWGIAPSEFAAAYLTNGTGLWRRGRRTRSLAAALARVRRADSRHLGTNVKEMLALGAHLNHDQNGYHYARAQNLRATLRQEFDAALEVVDVLAAPGTPTPALELGGFERGVTPPVNWDTHPSNLTGHPSICVPCGESDGRPVGLQLIGPWNGDKDVIDVAHTVETAVR